MSYTGTLLVILALLLSGCASRTSQNGGSEQAVSLAAQPWTEADNLFFENTSTPQWKGADVANTVAIDQERILWVFGDTLIREAGVNSCERFDKFDIPVHNSLALQKGSNPTTADISHFWGSDDFGAPASFFAPDDTGDDWYWMGGVTVLDKHVLIFLMHARSAASPSSGADPSTACAGLNFEMLGWDARIARITPNTPDQWDWQTVNLPENTKWHNILAGSSTVMVIKEHLYAWSAGQASLEGNPVFLSRWPLKDAANGDLSNPAWYTDSGWRTQAALGNTLPSPIVNDGNNEVSISRYSKEGGRQSWLWLQNSQIINSPLCYRTGKSLVDFNECRELIIPPELELYPDSKLLVYAAKLHPALTGGPKNSVIATYVVNSCTLKDVQEKCDLYYPRFITIEVSQ